MLVDSVFQTLTYQVEYPDIWIFKIFRDFVRRSVNLYYLKSGPSRKTLVTLIYLRVCSLREPVFMNGVFVGLCPRRRLPPPSFRVRRLHQEWGGEDMLLLRVRVQLNSALIYRKERRKYEGDTRRDMEGRSSIRES